MSDAGEEEALPCKWETKDDEGNYVEGAEGATDEGFPVGEGKMTFPNGDYFEGTYVKCVIPDPDEVAKREKEEAEAAAAAADAEPPADGEPPAEEEEKPPIPMITISYRQGKGKYVFKPEEGEEGEEPNLSGGYYEGEFVDNEKHGHGVMVFPDKSKYEGDFVRGVMHGRGRYEYPSGDFYVGAFAEGIKHGFGDYFFAASMSTFMGRWEKGAFVEGEWVLKDGSRYEGAFENGRPVGKGAFTWAKTGNSQSGAWEGAVFKGGKITAGGSA